MSGVIPFNSNLFPNVDSQDEIELTSLGDSFDPVMEIRRLRRELAQRLEALGQSEESDSGTKEKEGEENPEGNTTEKSEESEISEKSAISEPEANVVEITVEKTAENTIEVESEFPKKLFSDPDESTDDDSPRENSEAENEVWNPPVQERTPIESLRRIEETRQLLSRLQHPSVGIESLVVAETAEKSADESTKESEAAVFRHPNAVASRWIALLKKMNSGMVLIGFLGIVLGTLYHVRGMGDDIRIGLPVALIGSMLIVIGVAGRVTQDYLNRRDARRGKLTTVS